MMIVRDATLLQGDPNAFSGPPIHFASGPQTVPQNVGARRIVLHHAGRLRSSAHADAEAHYRLLLSGSPAYVQGEPLNSSDGVLNGIHDTTARARLSCRSARSPVRKLASLPRSS